MNFIKDHAAATREINGWVEMQTQKRIRDLIPKDGLGSDTRLVLVNALYFKAAWSDDFDGHATAPAPFYVNGAKSTNQVPTMSKRGNMKYFNGRGFQSVTLPYAGNDLHFLLIVPDNINGIADVEKKLKPGVLQACAKADDREVILHLPKFKITPPTIPLGDVLQKKWAWQPPSTNRRAALISMRWLPRSLTTTSASPKSSTRPSSNSTKKAQRLLQRRRW